MKFIKNKSPKAQKARTGIIKAMSVISITTLLFSFTAPSLIVIAEDNEELITNEQGGFTPLSEEGQNENKAETDENENEDASDQLNNEQDELAPLSEENKDDSLPLLETENEEDLKDLEPQDSEGKDDSYEEQGDLAPLPTEAKDEIKDNNSEQGGFTPLNKEDQNEELITNEEDQHEYEQGEITPLSEEDQSEDDSNQSDSEQGEITPLSEEDTENEELGTDENDSEQGDLAPLPTEAKDEIEDNNSEQGGFTPLPAEAQGDELSTTKEEKKKLKRIDKIKVKIKKDNLNENKQNQLLKKIEKIEKKTKKQETTKAIKDLKQKKKELRQSLKNKKNSKEEKEEVKQELKNQLELLKQTNQKLKEDLEEQINLELTDEEKGQIEYIEPNYLFELQEIITNEEDQYKNEQGGFTPLPAEDQNENNNQLVNNFYTPNDTLFTDQWSLNWVTGGQLASPNTTERVIVAIIDTGIDYNHSDLQGQFWISETCVDELNEPIEGGCTKGGWDFVDEDADPYPDDNYSHGTAVAGIIAANTNNNLGIASLSNNSAQIMALRTANEGLFELDDIISAIYFAVNNGADIINMSFGGPSYSAKLEEAIAYAKENNVIITAAAGNYASNNDITPIYPASFDLDNIISVAALSSPLLEGEGQGEGVSLAYFSNYGANTVDIAAPGTNILTTVLSNDYSTLSGTSFAAPMVASALSLYVADPDFSYLPEEITDTEAEPATSNE